MDSTDDAKSKSLQRLRELRRQIDDGEAATAVLRKERNAMIVQACAAGATAAEAGEAAGVGESYAARVRRSRGRP